MNLNELKEAFAAKMAGGRKHKKMTARKSMTAKKGGKKNKSMKKLKNKSMKKLKNKSLGKKSKK
jgi:hypothetical protein|uniref:Uncharacterized protein n=1 Tax=viral metagenome TaxID=1070528 RepID=A0A6C0IS35_9ZZZZ